MTVYPLTAGTPDAYQWLEHTPHPRKWAWQYALGQVRGDVRPRQDFEVLTSSALAVINKGLAEAHQMPADQWDAFVLWSGEAYRHLMDDGPVVQVIENLRSTRAVLLFQRQLGKVSILGKPAAPILEGPLPLFRGLPPPPCRFSWNAAEFVTEIITIKPPGWRIEDET